MRKVLLAAIALVMVTPFLYMVSVSFMGEAELLRWPPPLLPHAPTTANYSAMVEALPYGRVLLNTAILAACGFRVGKGSCPPCSPCCRSQPFFSSSRVIS